MKKEIRTIIASLFVFGLSSEGAVSVTASRTYVDSRTSLSPVTDNGQVVGFKLGIHTNGNEVLAAKSYVDNSTPGDYATVSNAAISAAAQTNDFLRKTGGTMTGAISMSSGSRLHFDESSGGNGPLGAITSGGTNLTARAEMENYVTNITSKIKTDSITDGTNTIDAAGNVYLKTNGWTFRLHATGIASDATSDQIREQMAMGTPVWGYGLRYSATDRVEGWFIYQNHAEGYYFGPDGNMELEGYEFLGAQGGRNATSIVYGNDYDWSGDGDIVEVSGTIELDAMKFVGKLALTNDLDFTTSNAQLVETIESVAPVPGNYTVVSNAAMNARSMTELGVRGAPQGEGSWFTIDGYPTEYNSSYDYWQSIAGSIYKTNDNYHAYIENVDTGPFSLNVDNGFSISFNINDSTYTIIGYTNTLAQVSQIPVVPQGIVTTNASGTLEVQGGQLRIAPSLSAGLSPDSARVIIGGYSEGYSQDESAATLVVGETDNSQLYGGRVIINGGGSYLQDPIIIAGGWSDADDHEPTITVNGTNIIPIVFGAAHKSDIDYTTSNQQLVETIEATAPSPGDYANVSNAAMRARSMTDLSYNGIVTNDFWDVTGGVSVRLYRKQISGGADYWESQDGVWALAYAGGDWLFGQSQNPVYIYEPADAGSLSCTIVGTAYFLTRVSGKSGMIALTNDMPVVSAEDPTFSNAVVSVMINVETNAIAAINSLIDQGDELPVGGAATVGALLLAMAAAIAGLSKKKASKNVLTLVESGSAFELGQNVSVLGRNFPASAWQGKTIAISGVSEVSITYGGYASDCSVKLDGTPIGTPDSVQITQDSILEVSFATCLDQDTPILMADKSEKKLSDVKVGDIVSTPFGPDKVVEVSSGRGGRMDLWEFEDGTTIRTIGRHRFWNVDLGEFMYLEAWNIGERALKADGTETRLARHGLRFGDFGHATLFTEKGNVYYANGLVAGNRRSRTLRRSST